MIPSVRKMLFAMILFVVVDAVWLLTAGRYALAMTERIQGSPVTFRFAAAIPVYIALAYLIYQVDSVQDAALMGAATYAIYDFTSLAILKKYEVGMAVADTLWGGALFAIVFTLIKKLGV
jgi:uncharacterized membrane protein